MSIDLRPNTVAQYKMNDNAADDVVVETKGTNGTYVGGNTDDVGVSVDGQINTALGFDGSTQYIDTNQTFESTFQDSFSINFWAKPDDGQPLSNTMYLMGVEDGDNNSGILLRLDEDMFRTSLIVDGDELELDVEIFDSGEASDFTMVTVIYESFDDGGDDRTRATVYKNGDLVGSDDVLMLISQYSSDFSPYISAKSNEGGVSQPFDGDIDNLCIFNKILTLDDIAFLYSGGIGTELLTDIPEPEVETKTITIGTGLLSVTIPDGDSEFSTPNTLLCSYVDSSLQVENDFQTPTLNWQGMPLSVSQFFDPAQESPDNVGNFFAIDVIKNTNSGEVTSDLDDSGIAKHATWNGNKIQISLIDNKYYLNVIDTEITAEPYNKITFQGTSQATGIGDELILNDSGFTMDDIDTDPNTGEVDIKSISLGGVPISIGRVGFKYYLIVKEV